MPIVLVENPLDVFAVRMVRHTASPMQAVHLERLATSVQELEELAQEPASTILLWRLRKDPDRPYWDDLAVDYGRIDMVRHHESWTVELWAESSDDPRALVEEARSWWMQFEPRPGRPSGGPLKEWVDRDLKRREELRREQQERLEAKRKGPRPH